tara:strand:- start:85 stop:420 length:336 start_codon:yes stop_codon:yes gene_type:complete
MAYGFKSGGRSKGTANKISKEFQEVLEEFMNDAIEEIPQLYNKLKPKEKIEYFIKLSPYMSPKKTEKTYIDESEIPEQPLFIENTMVVTSEKYKEMKENGRIDDEGNLINK